jgi:hypothetical protein
MVTMDAVTFSTPARSASRRSAAAARRWRFAGRELGRVLDDLLERHAPARLASCTVAGSWLLMRAEETGIHGGTGGKDKGQDRRLSIVRMGGLVIGEFSAVTIFETGHAGNQQSFQPEQHICHPRLLFVTEPAMPDDGPTRLGHAHGLPRGFEIVDAVRFNHGSGSRSIRLSTHSRR